MESILAALIGLAAALGFYRYFRQRNATPQQRVASLLRDFNAAAKGASSEHEAMLSILLHRRGWKELPMEFLGEMIRRLKHKEAFLQFVTLAEDRGYLKEQLPAIAMGRAASERIDRVACLLARFGYELQSQDRFKEAEFVQKLALALGPDCPFTNLPLAATYFAIGRFSEARPLFDLGLNALTKRSAVNAQAEGLDLGACLGGDIDSVRLEQRYREMAEQCQEATPPRDE